MFNSPGPNGPRDGDDLSLPQTPHQSQLGTFRCFDNYSSDPLIVESDNLGGLLITLHSDDLIPTFLDLLKTLRGDVVDVYLTLSHPETSVEKEYSAPSLEKVVIRSYLSNPLHQLLLVTPNYAELSVCAIKESDSLEIRICRNKSILIFCEDPIRRSVFEGVLRNKGFAGLPTISPNELSQEIQPQENRSQLALELLQGCFNDTIQDLGLKKMDSDGSSKG